MKKVAIVGYAQTRHQFDMPKPREDMVFDTVKSALASAGITRETIQSVVTASTDFLDGRTISNVFLSMACGAYLKNESKVEEDGSMAMFYAYMQILSGIYDVVLVEAHTQSSVFNPHQVNFYTLDPLFDRQLGIINDVALSAIQARMYIDKYDVSLEHLALVAVKNLTNAGKNPCADRKMPDLDIEEVLESKLYYEPLRELMISQLSDGCAVVILASEEKAREITDKPVWIEGVGFCYDGYHRDRDLLKLESLRKSAQKAYEMAGITDPYTELDILEISELYAHEELMFYEALGIAREGKGKVLLEKGITDINGELPVNPSGGALSADPICATGLVRVIEVAKQIRGEANGYQIPGVRKGLAHGQFGVCAQKNIVWILGGEA